ncbi:hypothetical protein BaRGS_00014753 [Batillaria attramentaria]|uniref:Uncharacterized protein n=1 Tax=Batillaria attramentaria TaxID=370345 RepID=A0ABD0L2W9_9CAEN
MRGDGADGVMTSGPCCTRGRETACASTFYPQFFLTLITSAGIETCQGTSSGTRKTYSEPDHPLRNWELDHIISALLEKKTQEPPNSFVFVFLDEDEKPVLDVYCSLPLHPPPPLSSAQTQSAVLGRGEVRCTKLSVCGRESLFVGTNRRLAVSA